MYPTHPRMMSQLLENIVHNQEIKERKQTTAQYKFHDDDNINMINSSLKSCRISNFILQKFLDYSKKENCHNSPCSKICYHVMIDYLWREPILNQNKQSTVMDSKSIKTDHHLKRFKSSPPSPFTLWVIRFHWKSRSNGTKLKKVTHDFLLCSFHWMVLNSLLLQYVVGMRINGYQDCYQLFSFVWLFKRNSCAVIPGNRKRVNNVYRKSQITKVIFIRRNTVCCTDKRAMRVLEVCLWDYPTLTWLWAPRL